MTGGLKSQVFLGIWRFMIPLPQALIKRGISRTADTICRKTAGLSEEERSIHRFVVMTMTDTNEPVSPAQIAERFDMAPDLVRHIVDKLEAMKVFFYRSNGQEINWAYPVTVENVVHRLTFSSGQQCFAA